MRGSIFIGAEKQDFLSAAIRNVSKSNWSHTAIILDSTPFETYVFGSRIKGSDITTLTEYNNTPNYYYEIYEIKFPQQLIDKALRIVLDEYLGKRYAFAQLAIGFPIWYKLKDWFGLILKKNPITKDTLCSELNTIYLQELSKLIPNNDIKEVETWDADLIAPENIYQLILRNKHLFNLKGSKNVN